MVKRAPPDSRPCPRRALPWCPSAATSSTVTPPAAAKVAAFLTRALEATGGDAPALTAALVPWVCDALQSNHSVKAYHRDLTDFFRHMQAQGVTPSLYYISRNTFCFRKLRRKNGARRGRCTLHVQ